MAPFTTYKFQDLNNKFKRTVFLGVVKDLAASPELNMTCRELIIPVYIIVHIYNEDLFYGWETIPWVDYRQ